MIFEHERKLPVGIAVTIPMQEEEQCDRTGNEAGA